jgi:hypothetical protein
VDVPFSTSTALATRDELFSADEQLALAGSWPATAASPATPTPWICANTLPGAPNTGWRCSVPVAPTSSVSPVALSPWAGRGPPSPGGCARWPALPLRRTGRPDRGVAGGACAPTPPGLRVPCHGAGSKEVGALLVAAGLAGARDHALVSLLALNGLRDSEAIGANIEDLGLERGHRTLRILRKGGKVVTIPLAPRTARAIDLAVGERCEGPIFVGASGERIDRHAAGRIVRRIARRAEIAKRVGPHTLRHAFITAALDAGVPLRDVQEAASHADPRTTMRYDRARVSLDRHATNIVATFLAGASR